MQRLNQQANKDLNTATVYTNFPTNKITSQQLDTMCYTYNTTTSDLVATIKHGIKISNRTIKRLKQVIDQEQQELAHYQHKLNHTLKHVE